MVSEERRLSGVAEFGPGPEGRICAGMQKLSQNAEAEWNVEVVQACGRCAGAESAGALGARSVRENGSCGEFGSRPQRPFPGAVRGFLPESRREAIRRKNGLCGRAQAFSGQGEHEGQRFPEVQASERRTAPLCEEKSPKGGSKAFLCARLKRELWRSSFVLR